MGSSSKKKRSTTVSEQHEEEENAIVSQEQPLTKKPKNTESSATPSSMESKKKRKAFQKERRSAKSKSKSELADSDSKPATVLTDSASGSGGDSLPEFHIGVFKDLAAAAELVREAAAKQMVTELKEVQNAYGGVQGKESGDGGFKLEAEKNDGLEECAPSVRYAVRRLIRGVSSSREVCFCVLFGSYIVVFILFPIPI